jgi:hypothetical protein
MRKPLVQYIHSLVSSYIPTPYPVEVKDANGQQQQVLWALVCGCAASFTRGLQVQKVCVGGDFMACVTSEGEYESCNFAALFV